MKGLNSGTKVEGIKQICQKWWKNKWKYLEGYQSDNYKKENEQEIIAKTGP